MFNVHIQTFLTLVFKLEVFSSYCKISSSTTAFCHSKKQLYEIMKWYLAGTGLTCSHVTSMLPVQAWVMTRLGLKKESCSKWGKCKYFASILVCGCVSSKARYCMLSHKVMMCFEDNWKSFVYQFTAAWSTESVGNLSDKAYPVAHSTP